MSEVGNAMREFIPRRCHLDGPALSTTRSFKGCYRATKDTSEIPMWITEASRTASTDRRNRACWADPR